MQGLFMYRSFGIGILIFSFSLSNVSAALAQPYDFTQIDQQMLDQDMVNRDQELAVRGIVDDNQRLAGTALFQRQEDTLEIINQTLINYRDFLLAHEQPRVITEVPSISKYNELVKLTEDVDNMRRPSLFNEMDQKSALYNEILAEKNSQDQSRSSRRACAFRRLRSCSSTILSSSSDFNRSTCSCFSDSCMVNRPTWFFKETMAFSNWS